MMTFCLSGTVLLYAEGVNKVRIERLAKGVNLSYWMWLNNGEPTELEKRFPDSDFELMTKLGLTHVRIPVEMANLYDPQQPESLNQKNLSLLAEGIEKILTYKLAVIVDLHSIFFQDGGVDFSGPLGKDESFTETFTYFWGNLAKYLSRLNPDWVYLEPMNEPVLIGQEEKWPPLQKTIIRAIRENAPQHTILATGAQWSNPETLLKLQPLDDPNVLYNFHFYEPHIFTHQGADWAPEPAKYLHDIPYPSSPESIQQAIELNNTDEAKKAIQSYGEERWNAKKIESKIAGVVAWANKNNVTVICNEFGAYRDVCPPQFRSLWIHDVRVALEKHSIGWSMWDFDKDFGMINRENGTAIPDPLIVKALGLNNN
jgi:aryl-phospho-beta-D-glucosidase BglC (GH1 family)